MSWSARPKSPGYREATLTALPSLMVNPAWYTGQGPMKTIAVGAVFALVIIVLAVWARLDWVDQCVADGHQRYECEERYDRAHPPATQINVHHH